MSRTHGYSQSLDSRWKICGRHTSQGACFALSAWWIIQMSSGASEGFWDWLRPSDYATGRYQPPREVNPVREASNWRSYAPRAGGTVVTDVVSAMANQALALNEGDMMTAVNTKLNCVAKIIEANSTLRPEWHEIGVKARDLPRFYSGQGWVKVLPEWAARLSKHHGYKYISIAGNAMRAPPGHRDLHHGIAVLTGSGTYCVFDPNFGEFTSDSPPEFQQDLGAIFNCYDLQCSEANYAIFR